VRRAPVRGAFVGLAAGSIDISSKDSSVPAVLS
jgi:hypothetical protein